MAAAVDDAWRELMAFEIERNRELYDAARDRRAACCRPGRPAASPPRSTLYSRILDRIEARDYDVFSGRARVPTWRKAVTAATVLVAGPRDAEVV